MNYIRDFDKIDEDRSIYYYIRQLQIIVARASEEIETTKQYTNATSSLESVNSATALETIHDIETNLPINTTYTETVDYGGNSDDYGNDSDITIEINDEGDDTNVSINTGENTVNVDTQDNTSTVTNTDNTTTTTTNTGTTTTNTETNTTTTTTSGGTTVTESPNDIASGIDTTGGGWGTDVNIINTTEDGESYIAQFSDGTTQQVTTTHSDEGITVTQSITTSSDGSVTFTTHTETTDTTNFFENAWNGADSGTKTSSDTTVYDQDGNVVSQTHTSTTSYNYSDADNAWTVSNEQTTVTSGGTTTTTNIETTTTNGGEGFSSTITTTDENGNTTTSSVLTTESGATQITDANGNTTTYDQNGFDTSDPWTDDEQADWDSDEDANFWGDE